MLCPVIEENLDGLVSKEAVGWFFEAAFTVWTALSARPLDDG